MAANDIIRPFESFIFVCSYHEYLGCGYLARGKTHKPPPVGGNIENYDEFKSLFTE